VNMIFSSSSPKSSLFSPRFVPILDPPLISSNTHAQPLPEERGRRALEVRVAGEIAVLPTHELGSAGGDATGDERVGVGGEREES
jgi:hypothetical protein